MSYRAQTGEIRHILNTIAGLPGQLDAGLHGDLDQELVDAVLEEAGRFAAEVIAPANRPGDVEGARLEADGVHMPAGWGEVYRQWAEGGWAALPCPPDHGGQGLPLQVGLAAQEIWNTASMAFGIGTVLTQGATEALHAHGSEELKSVYLPKMISGEWTGTMNLTEPQSGSDLSGIRTKAEPAGDGTYRIRGTKIYITYGDHDLTENIVHLVLARIEGAPEGTRGISLFLVPKFLVNADGSMGVRNDVVCSGLEEKLGIHASATCVMSFGDNDGAVGWLVGEENRGLNCMFTMMNNARLHVGIQGVAIAERAWQQALAYASERRQGKRPGSDGPVAIIEHPDVRRMLLTMKSLTQAARTICYMTARALDLARRGATEKDRQDGRAMADLLTPVAKAFSTDIGMEVASLGVQVHGGMGFIEETGAAQHYRDARIAPIYEGTNGIQAIDLVTRKLPMADGDIVYGLVEDLRRDVDAVLASNRPGFGNAGYRLSEAVAAFAGATDWLLDRTGSDPDAVLAGATPYLRLFGLTAGGAWLVRGALGEDADDATVHLARFFCENVLTAAGGLAATVTGGSGAFDDIPAAQFALS